MSDSERLTEEQFHKKSAVDLFNAVWDLLDKPERSKSEDDLMVHAAHASRYHWGKVGSPLELERGEWQISRVYSVLKRPEPALYHAGRCLAICEEHSIGDFDIAFAYEAMARAHALAGEETEASKYAGLAKEAGSKIEKKGDRDYFFTQLETVPGHSG